MVTTVAREELVVCNRTASARHRGKSLWDNVKLRVLVEAAGVSLMGGVIGDRGGGDVQFGSEVDISGPINSSSCHCMYIIFIAQLLLMQLLTGGWIVFVRLLILPWHSHC